MKTTCLTFYDNLREACSIYARQSFGELKAIKEPVHFSEDFTMKMRKLIKMVDMRQRKIRNEKLRVNVSMVLSRAAVVILVTIALALTVSLSVEATRNSILEYLTEVFDDHIRISSVNMDPYGTAPVDNGVSMEKDMLDVYVDRLVEMGFEVVKHDKFEADGRFEFYVLFNEAVEITMSRFPITDYQITTMHYDKKEKHYIEKDANVYWIDDNMSWYWIENDFVYEVTMNVEYEESVRIIERLLK